MRPAAQRVQSALAALGLAREIIELDVQARTSQQAADAVGVGVGQIAKSLVFTVNGTPVLVIASGVNRVDEARLGELAGGTVRRADPDTVRQSTGYVIGGVPPFGYPTPLRTFIDRDLLQHPLIYAAAGVPECVFPLTPDELLRATDGRVEDIKVEAGQPSGPAAQDRGRTT